MNSATLPYAVLLLLAEFTIGGQLALYATDLRGTVTRGFVKLSAGMIAAGAALTLWLAYAIAPAQSVAGYALAQRYFEPARAVIALALVLIVAYAVLIACERRKQSLILGALASAAAIASLALVSAIVQIPTWSYAGTFLSLLLGGLALGGVTLAMSLGHWYLVTPRLPEQPLNEMTLGLLGILGLETLLLVVNLIAPVREAPQALTVGIGQNPALWLRVGVGLLFPIALCSMAWRSSRMRGMMSATGLLYLATGAVLAGEALACALLFTTAIPG